MKEREAAVLPSLDERVRRFLERDLLLNFHISSSLAHEHAEVLGLAESGEAVVGVAVATKAGAGGTSLLRLDAVSPVALRGLLSSLPAKPERIMLHRSWQREIVEQELGAVRVRSGVEMFTATAADLRRPPDDRVRELTPPDFEVLEIGPASWIADLARDRLARGWQIYGIFSGKALVAHTCRGFHTGEAEEICDLFTAPSYRGRGLATAVVTTAAHAILAAGRQPVYFSRSMNRASQHVALRSGFRRIASLQEVAFS